MSPIIIEDTKMIPKYTFALLLLVCHVVHATCEAPSDLDVISWSYEAMLATHNMSYKDLEDEPTLAKSYYTKKAWSEYDDFLKNHALLERIKENQLTVMVGLQTSPTIVNNTKNVWTVEMPLLVNYESTGSYNTEREKVKLDIYQNKNCVLKIKKIEKR